MLAAGLVFAAAVLLSATYKDIEIDAVVALYVRPFAALSVELYCVLMVRRILEMNRGLWNVHGLGYLKNQSRGYLAGLLFAVVVFTVIPIFCGVAWVKAVELELGLQHHVLRCGGAGGCGSY